MIAIVPMPISRRTWAFRHYPVNARLHIRTVIANEDDERALWPAHVGKRVAFAVHTFELEVARLPAEVANALFGQCHYKPSALIGIKAAS
jgi:hypothetical protein